MPERRVFLGYLVFWDGLPTRRAVNGGLWRVEPRESYLDMRFATWGLNADIIPTLREARNRIWRTRSTLAIPSSARFTLVRVRA